MRRSTSWSNGRHPWRSTRKVAIRSRLRRHRAATSWTTWPATAPSRSPPARSKTRRTTSSGAPPVHSTAAVPRSPSAARTAALRCDQDNAECGLAIADFSIVGWRLRGWIFGLGLASGICDCGLRIAADCGVRIATADCGVRICDDCGVRIAMADCGVRIATAECGFRWRSADCDGGVRITIADCGLAVPTGSHQ